MLYRDLPTRCQCGHWFKLVDMERFEREREKHWQQVKDKPENIKLQIEFDEVEKELGVMIQQGHGLNNNTPGLTDFLEQRFASVWRYPD
ncbi:unnamed protein product [Dicrocoelium dendriticum]|nr:unnamed protein product [Dicrocoelium dendriticum]